MPAPFPELEQAMAVILDMMDRELREGGYSGEQVRMYLAGGIAVNYHCGSRYTGDIDAKFSQRVLFGGDIATTYVKPDGRECILYLDKQYNPDFGLFPEDYAADAMEWRGVGNEKRLVALWVLSPLALAVTKVSRLSEQDQRDIYDLAGLAEGGFGFEELEGRVADALQYYACSPVSIRQNMAVLKRSWQSRVRRR